MKLRNLLITFIFLLLTFSFISCDTTDPGDPPEVRPRGYQEHIPWPSLADSPWPMAAHDPQGTSRSKLPGPDIGELKWEFIGIRNTPGIGTAILSDSSIVYNSDTLRVFDGYGNVLWKKFLSNIDKYNTPTVDKLSNIYCCSDEELYSFSKDGVLRWKFTPKNDRIIYSESVGIDKSGNLYFFNGTSTLYSVDSEGNLIWELTDEDLNTLNCTAQMTFSPNGEVIYLPGFNKSIIAVNSSTGTIKWKFGEGFVQSHAPVDNDGNIYFYNHISEKLQSISANAELRWSFSLPDYSSCDKAPAIDWQGNILFATDTLYSLSYTGELNWKQKLVNRCDAPITIDRDNNIYVITSEDFDNGFYINSYTNEGALRFSNKIHAKNKSIGGSPAISFNKSIIITLPYNELKYIQ